MDLKILKSDIIAFDIPKFMIFIDNEPALTKQYINSIGETIGKKPTYFDSASEVLRDIDNRITSKCFYVIYDDDSILKNTRYVDELIERKDHDIVVIFSNLDKKSDVYKNYKNYCVLFDKVDKNTILAYAQKLCRDHKCRIDQDKLIALIERCDCNLSVVLNELDKIFTLEQENSNVLMDYMLNNGFSDYRSVNIYSFVNKILSRDTSVFEDVYRLKDESSVGIIALLYNMARTKLLNNRNAYYGNIMKLCNEVYQSIVNNSIGSKYAIKYILMKVFL